MSGQNSKTRASKEFLELVKAIGECKSKSEEDSIMIREVESLKARFADSKMQQDKTKLKELLLRLLYVDMLGHDASFGYIHAVKMCNEHSLVLKKVGYMTTALFLDENHELIILIVNTLQQDLRSDNMLIVCTALTASAKLASSETIPALLQSVLDLLPHPRELVRKKAVLTLHCFFQRCPDAVAPHLNRFRQLLCDKDPSVMAATLCVLHDMIAVDAAPYKNLVPSFVNILKQVVEHRLPKTYNYHRVPAPFIQIRLMKILGYLGASDRSTSEHMYSVLSEVLRRGDSHNTIGNALLYECVKTVTKIYPNSKLLESCADVTARFLKSAGHNLKYIGIDALGAVVKINAKYAAQHQMAVIDCLEDPDDTLKRKTMLLLYKMTKPGNVEVIVEKMLAFLRMATEEYVKRDTGSKVIELAERYAPSNTWFIRTVNEVLEMAGDLVQETVAHNLMRLLAEGAGDDDDAADEELRTSAVEAYLELLNKPKLPGILLKIICWVLGEYGLTSPEQSASSLVAALVAVADRPGATDTVKGYVLSAVTKVCAHARAPVPTVGTELVRTCSTSRSADLNQRAQELQMLLELPANDLSLVLPPDSSCEAIEVDTELSFLNSYVAEALAHGAAPYVPEAQRRGKAAAGEGPEAGRAGSADRALRFQAYENPVEVSLHAQPTADAGPGSHASHPVPPSTASLSEAFGTMADHGGSAGRSSSGEHSAPRLNTGGGPRRWGAPAAPPPAPTPAPTAVHTTVSAPTPAAAAATPAPEEPREMTEKEKLAASLFGGLSGDRSGATSTARTARPPPRQVAAPTKSSNLDLLLDLNSPEAKPPTTAAAADPFAALEGLSLADPTPNGAATAPATAAFSTGFNLDSLYTPAGSQMQMGVGGGIMPMQMGIGLGMPGAAPCVAPGGGTAGIPPPTQLSGLGSMAGPGAPMNPQMAPAKAPASNDPFKDLLS